MMVMALLCSKKFELVVMYDTGLIPSLFITITIEGRLITQVGNAPPFQCTTSGRRRLVGPEMHMFRGLVMS